MICDDVVAEIMMSRDAREDMNLLDEDDIYKKACRLSVYDLGIKNKLGDIAGKWKHTRSAGCKKFKEFRFLMLLLALHGGDSLYVVEDNINNTAKGRIKRCRVTNPNTCKKDLVRFKARPAYREMVRLKRSGWNIGTVVVSRGYVDSRAVGWVNETQDIWANTTKRLRKLTRNGKVKVFYAHEMSVGSLATESYFPHTHITYFYQGEEPKERIEGLFLDYDVSFDTEPVGDLEGMMRYNFSAYTPMEVYRRELGDVPIRDLNRAVWNWVENARYVFKGVTRAGAIGFCRKEENWSLLSVNAGNKIMGNNYAYEKPRFFAGSRGPDIGGSESTPEACPGMGMVGEGGNEPPHHGGICEGSRGGVQGISSWPEGGNDGGGCGRNSGGRDVQGSRGDPGEYDAGRDGEECCMVDTISGEGIWSGYKSHREPGSTCSKSSHLGERCQV